MRHAEVMATSDTSTHLPDSELGRVTRAVAARELTAGEQPTVESLSDPIVSGTVGVWRVRGRDYTAVLKLLHHSDQGDPDWRSGDDPEHWYYWRREALFLTSDLPARVEHDLHVPECYAVAERADGTVAVWMEQVTGWAASRWDADDYGRVARHVGRLQGRLGGTALPDHDWLGRRWLAQYLQIRRDVGSILDETEPWNAPTVEQHGAAARADEYRALWARRYDRLARVEALPRTLCHFDLHPYNLFSQPDGSPGVIDWAFVGIGGIGEDAATLVFDTLYDFHLPPEQGPRLFTIVLDGYVAGLRDSGYLADRAAVRQAMLVTAAAKYSWTLPAALRALQQEQSTLNGRDTEDTTATWLHVGDFLLDLTAELE